MRTGGIILALLMLASCTSTSTATPPPSSATPTTTTTSTSSTPAAPDPALIEGRLKKAQLTVDMVAPLGYRVSGEEQQQKNYPVVACPEDLSTDGAMSATRMATHWVDKPAFSTLIQFTVSYRRVAAAAETVQLARKALECGTFTSGDSTYTFEKELAIPPLGADAQFAVCFRDRGYVQCSLLLTKADLLTSLTYIGPDDARAATDLEAAGRAVLPLLSS
ncbi:hypothetical protein ACQPZF_17600 [Actinosynnema sp. CS-041913]|uniref:hypothetical protein n=1 Tax=Actinosynnema sp. CS-041913 TaxID=3239917 RepID=UPI003D94A48B